MGFSGTVAPIGSMSVTCSDLGRHPAAAVPCGQRSGHATGTAAWLGHRGAPSFPKLPQAKSNTLSNGLLPELSHKKFKVF